MTSTIKRACLKNYNYLVVKAKLVALNYVALHCIDVLSELLSKLLHI